jgi:hypothetical protein
MRKYNVRSGPQLINNEDNKRNANISPQPKHMNNGKSDEKRERFVTFYTSENVDIEMGLNPDNNLNEMGLNPDNNLNEMGLNPDNNLNEMGLNPENNLNEIRVTTIIKPWFPSSRIRI